MNTSDNLNMLNQPVNVFTVNAPPDTKTANFPTRQEARAKEVKEKQELRLWWDNLPEDKRQEVRNQQFVEKKKKKPEAPKPPAPAPPPPPPPKPQEKKHARVMFGADL